MNCNDCEEFQRNHSLIMRQGASLRRVVNAIRGEPPPDELHSVHDAGQLVEDLVAAARDSVMGHDDDCRCRLCTVVFRRQENPS